MRPLDGILQSPIGVIQGRRSVQRPLALGLGLLHEPIRMKLAAQLIKPLLQLIERKIEPARDPEKLVIVRHAENDVPQPQLFFAFGLSNSKPE